MVPPSLRAALLFLLKLSAPAFAQPANLAIKAGEAVSDREGGAIGKVISIKGDSVIVDTGTAKVTLGESSFRRRDGKLILPMNKNLLEAESARVQSGTDKAISALLQPGKPFFDVAGERVGTIISVDGNLVLVEAAETKANLNLSAFSITPAGLAIHSTRADFFARLAAQKAARPDANAKPH